MNRSDLRAMMMTGVDRRAEAIAEHTATMFDRVFNVSSTARSNPCPVDPALVERPSPCDDAGTAGVVYPVTCRARYYDAASRILEEEGQLHTHDNANELGALIQQWIEDARDNWEPK